MICTGIKKSKLLWINLTDIKSEKSDIMSEISQTQKSSDSTIPFI